MVLPIAGIMALGAAGQLGAFDQDRVSQLPFNPPGVNRGGSQTGLRFGTAQQTGQNIPQETQQILGQLGLGFQLDPGNAAGEAGRVFSNLLTGLGGASSAQGLVNLFNILQSQGRTDPGLLNLELADIQRGGQAQQLDLEGSLARANLGGAGIGQALRQSIAGQTAGQRQQAIARENALAEERRRQDMQLFFQLAEAMRDQSAISTGQFSARQGADAQKKAAQTAAIGSIIAALASSFCWVARAIYGEGDVRWTLARHYVLTMAPDSFRATYLEHGPVVGLAVRRHPFLRRILKPAFDRMVDAAREDRDG